MAIDKTDAAVANADSTAAGQAHRGAQAAAHTMTDWDEFVANHAFGHLLQLSAWRALKCRFGWRASRATVGRSSAEEIAEGTITGGGFAGGAEVLYRRVAGLTIAYVPRGPVVDWNNADAVAAVLQVAEDEARHHGAAVLKIEPPLEDSLTARSLLSAAGYWPSRQSVQPPSTILIDLTQAEDAILQRMKSKWRYNIRLAARKHVTVREAGIADLPAIHQLMALTGERDGFAVHSAAYYSAAFELLTPANGVFLLAEFEGRPLAAIVVGLCGDTAIYLWGASNNEERSRMPNHALQWAGMRWAKARGARSYDLWGVPDAVGLLAFSMNRGEAAQWPVDGLPVDMEQLPSHDLWGVYRFKQGFGGQAVRFVGTWDTHLSPLGRVYDVGLWAREQAALAQATIAGLHTPQNKAVENKAVALPAAAGKPITQAHDWRTTLAQFDAPHVLQSWEWGEVKVQTGWTAHRFSLPDGRGNEPDAAFQLLCRRLVPGLPWGIGYIPKGPVVDWGSTHDFDALVAAIEEQAQRLGCIFVKIDPDVRADSQVGQVLTARLRQRGWQFSREQIQFKNTGFSDLSGDEDALLAGMKSKWRYNIRLAERRGITVRAGSLVDLPLFYGLYSQTGRRDGFLVRPYGYYLESWQTFLAAQAEPDNPAGGTLLLAEHPDEVEPLAGLFLMRYGDRAWYFYGASSERRRRDMPNYLLQWEAMRWAKAQGCRLYDWWGAPTTPDDPADSMQGVWQFKQGFGAEFQPHIGAWDYPVYPRMYRLFSEALPRVLQLLRSARSL